ncbi:hypothetical protein RG959_06625 [Domibacillus sp. 8LH]|jgi:hypothetical protein|uniref:hypothetical protein n=1 Tax=unclassified Domibacillus TaxID=2632383 RepID=UPI001F575493|nr:MULTISPECIES: hypothetical protein [unclassified Domibacillus]MCI2253350.1 hypothetical protein [Domibacillus sp. PGB-M46]WNS79952.1 hypothetical protein RRU94_20815 [Domibacillus sp. DTU_2020_1001157_1_SI_ALB_TIR_016]
MKTNKMTCVYRNGQGEWKQGESFEEELKLGEGTHFHIKCGETSKFYEMVSDRYITDRKDRQKTFYKFETPDGYKAGDRFFSVAYIDHRNQDITFDIHSE